MYVRLAFAVAAHLEPEILLVDEVLAVGDAAFQQKCLGKMQEVGRGGRTVLFVSHNMSAAAALCQRGLLDHGGELRVDAPVQESLKAYLSDATAAAANEWDVSGTRRDEGLGELARLRRLEILPTHPDGFRFGESLRFKVRFRAESTRRDLFVGAGVDDMFGHRLATFESHEVNFRVDVEAGRDYDVELSVPRPDLNPGRYFLSVSLSSGHTYFDVLFHAATFDVTPIDVATGDYFEPIPGAGPLRLPYTWARAHAGLAVASTRA